MFPGAWRVPPARGSRYGATELFLRTATLGPTLLALCACGPAAPTYYQQVKPILDSRCITCHTAGAIAPFALDSYPSAKARAQAAASATAAGLMPPWRAGAADVTYLYNPSLTDDQKATLAAWAKAGAPEGDKARPGADLPKLAGGIQRVDLTLAMQQPYAPTLSPDDYRCFPLVWPETTPVFVTGFDALPGVTAMVHHVALYLVPPDSAQAPFQWDAEDTAPGYSCFGGPFGNRPQEFAVNLLTAWIPGTQGVTFPRNGGVPVPPGATVVIQMHYNTAASLQPDQSSFQFQLASSVDRQMVYQPFLDPGWVAGQMNIPAGATNVPFLYQADPRDFFSLLGSTLDTTNGFNIEAVMFHMHKLGAEGQLWLERPDHTHVKVLDISNWDFHWQLQYSLETPVRFQPGDQLRLKCVFDNSPGRISTVKDVNWGEGSEDEMCVANILSSR